MTFSRKKKDDELEEDKKKKHESKLDAKLFSFTTFYYFVSSTAIITSYIQKCLQVQQVLSLVKCIKKTCKYNRYYH